MRHDFITNGRTEQVRADWPEGEAEMHPRAREMGDAMLDIAARGAGCTFKDLIREGFTSAEIIEHNVEAEKYSNARYVRQTTVRVDLMADIIAKARAPLPNAPPLTGDMKETQANLVVWGNYCAARQALVMDPWTGQRERALQKLSAYLNRMPIFPRIRDEILQAVSSRLPKVSA